MDFFLTSVINVVATEGNPSYSLSQLTDRAEEEEGVGQWTQKFSRPAHERRRGRTDALVFSLYSQATLLQLDTSYNQYTGSFIGSAQPRPHRPLSH
jgi:hypothetical protein